MIHPDTELRYVNDKVGYGVFARQAMPCGTMTYVRDSLEIVFQPDDPRLEDPNYRPIIAKYATREADGTLEMSWDIAKYVNHCCNFNTISTAYGFEIAVRDIGVGEEITDEYGLFNMDDEMELYCHFPNCRGRLRQDDIDRYYAVWDELIRVALKEFQRVPQPLWKYLDEGAKREIMEFLNEGKNYRSVLTMKYRDTPPKAR